MLKKLRIKFIALNMATVAVVLTVVFTAICVVNHRQSVATVDGALNQAIAQAVADNTTIDLTDDKGRRIIVPAKALGYAIIGSETKHAVGFGTL